MRLLHTETLKLQEFIGDEVPPYAILSHRWASVKEEPTFRDVCENRMQSELSGFQKVRNACLVAKHRYDMNYIWIDTCCINKESSAELSEAINSMFMWYKNAVVCLAFLTDVEPGLEDTDSAFRISDWFTRAWTLQELLAPQDVEFFNNAWIPIGTKVEKYDLIEEVTGIPRVALENSDCIWEFEVPEKMTWASGRKATRIEDIAYSLTGLFDVNIPLLYGEGERAFTRLQEEIIRQANNITFLQWGIGRPTNRLLADSPSLFKFDIGVGGCYFSQISFNWTNIGLQLKIKLFRCGIDLYGIELSYSDEQTLIAMILRRHDFNQDFYYKVCVAELPPDNSRMAREVTMTILRGTRDQRIAEDNPKLKQYHLLEAPYTIEFQRRGRVTIQPYIFNHVSRSYIRSVFWTTKTNTAAYSAVYENPCSPNAASLICEVAGGGRFRVTFAFDFEWEPCLLFESLSGKEQDQVEEPSEITSHKISTEWPRMVFVNHEDRIAESPEAALFRISEEWPQRETINYQGEEALVFKIARGQNGVVCFTRMRKWGDVCARLPDDFLPQSGNIWLSLSQSHANAWLVEISQR